MFSIESCPLPDDALLDKYVRSGAYTDCYRTEVCGHVTHAQFVRAFYTTLIFKFERMILKLAVSKPSSDAQARQLANGDIDRFAAWYVENRCENQLLMSDFQGRTRSWFMVMHAGSENNRKTRLYFGSAVISVQNEKTDSESIGLGLRALLGFHKIYSEILLYSARSRLE
jgi:hypothetical protein